MSAAIHLAASRDAKALLPMVASYHAEEGIASTPEHREAALAPLLEGSPLGCVYIIGPRTAPIGYIVITFGWSLEFGGMDGFIDEFFVRPGVRGRGVGSEVLGALIPQLEANGLRALHLEATAEKPRLLQLYKRNGFRHRDEYHLMTRVARKRG